MTATAAEMADWLGISVRRVRELRADGVLPGSPGEPYDLKACVRAYCAHMRPSTGRAAAGGSESALNLDAARIRLLTEQADAQQMKNEILRAEYASIAAVCQRWETACRRARDILLAFPPSHAARLVRLKTPVEMRTALDQLVIAALTELSNPEWESTPSPASPEEVGLG